ncbi:MAG: hypothetical protein ABI336_12975 [Humibacillus sp.]
MIPVALVLRDGRPGGLSWSVLAGRLAASADACADVEHLFVAPCDESDSPVDEVELQAVLYVQRLDTAAAVAVAVEVASPLVEAGVLIRTAVPSRW